jgi:hypothetical protein
MDIIKPVETGTDQRAWSGYRTPTLADRVLRELVINSDSLISNAKRYVDGTKGWQRVTKRNLIKSYHMLAGQYLMAVAVAEVPDEVLNRYRYARQCVEEIVGGKI